MGAKKDSRASSRLMEAIEGGQEEPKGVFESVRSSFNWFFKVSSLHTTLHFTSLHYTTLHYTTLHYTTQHNTTLHDTTLHYRHYTTLLHHCALTTALHCTALRDPARRLRRSQMTGSWRRAVFGTRRVRRPSRCASRQGRQGRQTRWTDRHPDRQTDPANRETDTMDR